MRILKGLKLIADKNTKAETLFNFFFGAQLPKDNNFLARTDLSLIKNATSSAAITQEQSPIKISVVLATYNRARLISGAIDSLLAQTDIEKNLYELIIISDGATDETEKIVENYIRKQRGYKPNISLITLVKNCGASTARNIGILRAQGEFIASTDDDCILPPNWLYQFNKAFHENPEITAVGGYKEPAGTYGKPPSRYDLFMGWRRLPYMLQACKSVEFNPYNNCGDTANTCYRKNALLRAGGFNIFLGAWYDWELKMRLHNLHAPLFYIPLHIKHAAIFNLKSYARMWMLLGWDSFLIGKINPEISIFDTSTHAGVRRFSNDFKKITAAKKDVGNVFVKSLGDIIMCTWLSAVCNISFCLGKYLVPIFMPDYIAKLHGNKS